MANKLDQLVLHAPQRGTVTYISYRTERRGEVIAADSVQIEEGKGIANDHYGKLGNRMVTIMQEEHLATVAALCGKSNIDPKDTRRNILVKGFNLKALVGKQFSLGSEVILQGTGDCVPCDRMEENIGPGGYQAMVGHGGITCKVIRGGHISIGDELAVLSE